MLYFPYIAISNSDFVTAGAVDVSVLLKGIYLNLVW